MGPAIVSRLSILSVLAGAAAAQPFPEATISNGVVTAKLYLPDAEKGYYRATRFDWSGQIYSLQTLGHEFFGQWFPRYDPKLHDSIMGPVEEFRTGASALGYDNAAPGELFVRIGVGALRKPEEEKFEAFRTYEIVDSGQWTVKTAPDAVEFVHVLDAGNGYAYRYRKTVRLPAGKTELVIEHALENTGTRFIETSQYNHNFFVLDQLKTGPDFTVTFPFDLKAQQPPRGDAGQIAGRQIRYTRELARGETFYVQLAGGSPYDVRIENRRAKAGIRIQGDRPIDRIVYWSIPSTLCPEPYIQLSVPPRETVSWTYRYEFYQLPD